MNNNENLKNEEMETMEEKTAMADQENYSISDFGGIGRNSSTKTQVFTNITDRKKLFNLENKVDEMIRVKDVLIKTYEKPMKEPLVDEETGEILKDKEYSMSCVIVDDNGKSYATGSKMFTLQLMRYLQMEEQFGEKPETFDIKII